MPLGGPNGGDGGRGGNVVFKVERNLSTLNKYRHGKLYGAENGKQGGKNNKSGKGGDDIVLSVPQGTVIKEDSGVIIADLEEEGQTITVTNGGKGGWGNARFVSATNQAPLLAQKGEVGGEKALTLEMRLIADAAIIGYPNVGKSSLLTASSAARPKVASYPFTTLEPVRGVVETDKYTFVMAEVPGLITDAHLGRGLGHDFLRHIARTRVLIHVVDGSSETPVEDMFRVNEELRLYEPALATKPQVVAVNKVDLSDVQARIAEIKEAFGLAGLEPFFVSAVSGEGIEKLIKKTLEVIKKTEEQEVVIPAPSGKVFHPRPVGRIFTINREGNTFEVVSPELERVIDGTDINHAEARRQLLGYMSRRGVVGALKKAGAKPGDRVRLGRLEWGY